MATIAQLQPANCRLAVEHALAILRVLLTRAGEFRGALFGVGPGGEFDLAHTVRRNDKGIIAEGLVAIEKLLCRLTVSVFRHQCLIDQPAARFKRFLGGWKGPIFEALFFVP